ncbi:MAG: Nif3-like dinuclear metal center hexameric protein [Breznakibacter sp.]
MPQLKDIIKVFEDFAPPMLQEGYDNSGLFVGDPSDEIIQVLVTLDVTEDVMHEAIAAGANLVVSHHPLTLGGFKKITGRTEAERCVLLAIRHQIAIYSCHTNADAVMDGVSGKMAQRLGLTGCRVLEPKSGGLLKLVFFVPQSHAAQLRDVIFAAGAGHIGHYDSCSFNTEGTGTFRGDEHINPFVGEPGKLHFEVETKIETIVPVHLKGRVLKAMFEAHPYEEVAYDLYPLANEWPTVGFGMVGELPRSMDAMHFLKMVKETFHCENVRYTGPHTRSVRRVALCGGAGSSLLGNAMAAGADVFITADFKYHQFFDADKRIMIADIGHYESEQFTKELFFELLTKKFPNFAIRLSQVNSNPIKYL